MNQPKQKFKVGDRVYRIGGLGVDVQGGILTVTEVYWAEPKASPSHWRVQAERADGSTVEAAEEYFVHAS